MKTKDAEIRQQPESPDNSRQDLLNQIRSGASLKPSAERKLPEKKEEVSALFEALSGAFDQRYQGVEDPEMSSVPDEEWDEDWD